MKFRSFLLTFLLLPLIPGNLESQEAIVKEEEIPFMTYQYSDPDPVPHAGKIYPYFRFDGYTDKPIDKKWKVISMENEYIKLWVFPEIGGKIWGAIEKSTGKEFLYFNHVVKFRDVALRGPWTSGGLEMNFGIFGHAPTCSSPVDYLIRKNSDGSVSCFVGTMDLTSRTRWSVEINLPKDKAYFTTRCTWDNPTMSEQSYYQWMNAAIKVEGELEYVFPGNRYLDHDGKYFTWPVDDKGRNLFLYENNNFGSYKSYHTFGKISGFYGAYWKNDDFGFGHFSDYDEKPGKKIWIWGLSDQGMIWKKLLTDNDGQYTEVQSGRLFNQAAAGSSLTPFKNTSFSPGGTDEWIEYWYPIKNIHGLRNSIPAGSVNLIKNDNKLNILFCSNEKLHNRLVIKKGDKTIYNTEISAVPMQILSTSIDYQGDINDLTILLGEDILFKSGKDTIARPVDFPKEFNWDSMYGHYLKAREYECQRLYRDALEEYEKSLQKDSFFINSLTGLSRISYRQSDYQTSLKYSAKALSIDTYDPEANIINGVANIATGDTTSAIDAFSIASHNIEYRCAAYNSLATIYIRQGNFRKGIEYANKSLNYNVLSSEALQAKILCYRKLGKVDEIAGEIEKLNERDPLNHFIRIERYLANPVSENEILIQNLVKNEFPSETYLEATIWYYRNGQNEDALKVLNLSSENPIILLWKGYLNHLMRDDRKAADQLNRALSLSSEMVFPSRLETLKPLEWAKGLSDDWKLNYYMGLIYLSAGSYEKTLKCWDSCGELPPYFPFYAARSDLKALMNIDDPEDVGMVLKTGGKEWRAGFYAANFYLKRNEPEKACDIIKTFYLEHPANYYVGSLYARILFFKRDYSGCVELLRRLEVLPNEGASEIHDIWKMANIGRALDLMKSKNFLSALKSIDLAREWPVNLGVGKPFKPDERLEDFVALQVYRKLNDKKSALNLQKKIIDYSESFYQISIYNFLTAWILRDTGEELKADQLMKDLLLRDPQLKNFQWCNSVYSNESELTDPIEKDIVSTDYTFIILRRIFNEI